MLLWLVAASALVRQATAQEVFIPRNDPELILDDDTSIVLDMDDNDAEMEYADSALPLLTMPEMAAFVEADFPLEVQRAGIEGAVLMDMLVSDSGTVDSVAIAQGLDPLLDSSAVAAARRFRFKPATTAEGPVAVMLQYRYEFSLREVVKELEEYVNFSGVLIERGTRAPVADAMVVVRFRDTTADTSLNVPFGVYLERIGKIAGQYLEEDRLVTVTDSLGAFRFHNLPAGPIEITAPVSGYEEFV
jgi:TonB family protein